MTIFHILRPRATYLWLKLKLLMQMQNLGHKRKILCEQEVNLVKKNYFKAQKVLTTQMC